MPLALFGLIPVVNATGLDLSKSAMAQLIIEGVTLPASLLSGPSVEITGIDESRFTVTTRLHDETMAIAITVDADGRPTGVTMPRRGNLTEDGSYRAIPYGMRITAEQTFGGYTIQTKFLVAGGTEPSSISK